MRVSVDAAKCVGSGMCVATAPAVFGQDPVTALVQVLDPAPAADQYASVEQAATFCPASVIRLQEDD